MLSDFPAADFFLIAIGASQGGLKAVSEILSVLPADFPAAITIVQHLSADYPNYMAEILTRRTALRVKPAEDGERLRPGTVYTAVPNKHLIVKADKTLRLSNQPKVNFVRPAANKMFTSVAASFKTRAIAVVLTGNQCDGALGIVAIKKYGGFVIAQDEASCECFSMPKAAIATEKVDLILPLSAIADTLLDLVISAKTA
ncbi:chemotaxis protein CheB [Microcoleus sp. FACHB-672]|nr:chemotaxis protein CheB [Microcoleus sp. FACHB-672]